jgi:hypothetical protein
MKKTVLILFSLLLLTSCGSELVHHTEENPFIIGKIEKLHNGEIRYYKSNWERLSKEIFASEKQSITLSEDYGYSIGDTLVILNKKYQEK